jgi:hypothetical protein
MMGIASLNPPYTCLDIKRMRMHINSLEIVKSSGPSEFECLTLEVLNNSEPIVAINQEKGVDVLEVEVFGKYKGYGSGVTVPLDDLIQALIEVRQIFAKMNEK